MFDWDDLRIFLALARTRRRSDAGRAAGLDATTVGRRIARLEAALDTRLFDQTAAGHVLTEPGERLLIHAEGVEQAALDARAVTTGERRQLVGTVRVSVSEGFGSWVIARHIAGFSAENPSIDVEVVAASGFLNPSKREADLAVMLARPTRGAVVVRRLTDYRLGLYASRHYAERHPEPRSPAALVDHPLIGYVPDFNVTPELRYLDDVAPGLHTMLRSTSINAQSAMIGGGGGIGILPCFLGDAQPGLMRWLAPAIDIQRSFWLVVHKDARRTARVRAFTDWLQHLVTTLQPQLMGVRENRE